jgi:hypothetical protein
MILPSTVSLPHDEIHHPECVSILIDLLPSHDDAGATIRRHSTDVLFRRYNSCTRRLIDKGDCISALVSIEQCLVVLQTHFLTDSSRRTDKIYHDPFLRKQTRVLTSFLNKVSTESMKIDSNESLHEYSLWIRAKALRILYRL